MQETRGLNSHAAQPLNVSQRFKGHQFGKISELFCLLKALLHHLRNDATHPVI